MLKLTIIFVFIATSFAIENWLSAGLGGWSHDDLTSQFNKFKYYKEKNIITSSSVLLYYFNEDGTFGNWDTNAPDWSSKQFQRDIKTKLSLKAYPCFFCDETIGNCKPLDKKLGSVIANKQNFIASTIVEAKKYGWDGYSLDMESFSALDRGLTQFVIDWGKALDENGMQISIWVGGPTAYNMTELAASPYIHSIVTMNTYSSSFDSFQYQAQALLDQGVKAERAGFGLLNYDFLHRTYASQAMTNEQFLRKYPYAVSEVAKSVSSTAGGLKLGTSMPDEDMFKVMKWVKDKGTYGTSVWASDIPESWIAPLQTLFQ